MKNNKISTIIILLLVATMALVSSCNKEDEDTNTTATSTETFSAKVNSPEADKVFDSGETVNIEAEISNDKELHGYAVRIINKSMNNAEVFKTEHKHMHGKSYKIKESWVVNVNHHSDMELQIITYLDHSGTEKITKVDFHCHP